MSYHAAMRRFALAVAITLTSGVVQAAEPYAIDPQHLTLGFLVEHIGFAKVLGSFQEGSGTFRFDEATGRIEDVRVVVSTASVSTGVEDRDRHLRSEDFFDAERFPEMTFESPGGQLTDRRGTLTGVLTIRDRRRTVTLDVEWNKSGESPLPGNPWVAGFSVRGSFRRSDFGMTYGVADGLVGDEIELIIELEAQRQ